MCIRDSNRTDSRNISVFFGVVVGNTLTATALQAVVAYILNSSKACSGRSKNKVVICNNAHTHNAVALTQRNSLNASCLSAHRTNIGFLPVPLH